MGGGGSVSHQVGWTHLWRAPPVSTCTPFLWGWFHFFADLSTALCLGKRDTHRALEPVQCSFNKRPSLWAEAAHEHLAQLPVSVGSCSPGLRVKLEKHRKG